MRDIGDLLSLIEEKPQDLGNFPSEAMCQDVDFKQISQVSQFPSQKQDLFTEPDSTKKSSSQFADGCDQPQKAMITSGKLGTLGNSSEISALSSFIIGKRKEELGKGEPTPAGRSLQGPLPMAPDQPTARWATAASLLTPADQREAYVRIAGPGPADDGPALWRHRFYGLNSHRDPCPGFREGQWPQVYDAAHAFLQDHAEAAHGVGWSGTDLFAVNRLVGVANVSDCGALMVSGGAKVGTVGRDSLQFLLDGQPRGRFFRSVLTPQSVPIWEFGL